MANYATLKAAIQSVIKQNGNNEITGALLQQSLLSMINSLGAYYQFAGLATPSTNPGTPDQNVCYLASTAGTYSNFDGIVVNDGEACLLCYNGTWTKKVSGAATVEQVTALGQKVYDLVVDYREGYEISNEGYAINATRTSSLFIPVDDSLHYETNLNTFFIYCYDAKRNYLGFVNIGDALMAGTKFVRIQWPSANTKPYFYSYNPLSYDDYLNAEKAEKQTPEQYFEVGNNLYDETDPDCIIGKYITSFGYYTSSASLKISGYIPVKSGENYWSNGSVGYYAFYDKDYNPTHWGAMNSQPMTAQTGDKYLRVSLYISKDGTENIVNKGATLLPYEPYRKALKQKYVPDIPASAIADNAITTKKIADGAVTTEKSAYLTKNANLLDKSDIDYQDGKYFYINGSMKAVLGSAASLAVSGYIPVTPGDKIFAYYGHSYAFFDATKTSLTASTTTGFGPVSLTAPAGAAYVRFNLYINKVETNYGAKNSINIGSAFVPFIPFGWNVQGNVFAENAFQLSGNLGKNQDSITGDIADGATLKLENVPHSICRNNRYGLRGNFSSFSTLIVGRGTTQTNARYFKITATAVALYDYSGSERLLETKNHGLTISGYVNFSVVEKDGKANVILQTLSDSFEATFDNYLYYGNGEVRATASGMALTDCKLSWANFDLKCDTWAFGDSYFGMNYSNREMYWLKEWGALDKVLNQHYAGQSSVFAYDDLYRALDYGCPKRLIWALGMNDDNGSTLADITTGNWYENLQKVIGLCQERGIELILATVPQVRSTSYKNKDLMTAWVLSSGYRYVDVAAAVGSNAAGEWYGNGESYDYQSSDNVHPSEYGAKAIATQFLLDVPELE